MPVNTKQYAWADLSATILGSVVEFTGVKYTVKKEKNFVRGRGNKPLGINHGNEEVTGEITLLQSEVEKLSATAKLVNPKFKITDISFDIVLNYGDDVLVTDILKSVEVEEYEKGMENGDPNMEVTLKFKALDVQEGA